MRSLQFLLIFRNTRSTIKKFKVFFPSFFTGDRVLWNLLKKNKNKKTQKNITFCLQELKRLISILCYSAMQKELHRCTINM